MPRACTVCRVLSGVFAAPWWMGIIDAGATLVAQAFGWLPAAPCAGQLYRSIALTSVNDVMVVIFGAALGVGLLLLLLLYLLIWPLSAFGYWAAGSS